MNKGRIKIAYIGGGSANWAKKLMVDLATQNTIEGDLFLYDIDYNKAQLNVSLGEYIFSKEEAKSNFTVHNEKDIRRALDAADFVILSIEPGSIEIRYADLVIPENFGVLQTVGDTVGPGGMLRALRTVPTYTRFAHLIKEHAPDAWVINYTNPMTLCTAALYAAEPEIKAFGCCHEVFKIQNFLTEKVAQWFDVDKPKRSDIKLDVSGLNHFTFASGASWDGKDLFPYLEKMISSDNFFASRSESAQKRIAEEEFFQNDFLVALDFYRHFGVLGAAADRHLVEFVPWYLSDENNLHDFGVTRTPYSWRVKHDARKKASMTDFDQIQLQSTDEEGVDIILALLGYKDMVTNVNIPNTGQIPYLQSGHIVETNTKITKNNIEPITGKPLPQGIQSILKRVSEVQNMILDGINNGNRSLLLEALLNDPLVSIKPERASEMLDQMQSFLTEKGVI